MLPIRSKYLYPIIKKKPKLILRKSKIRKRKASAQSENGFLNRSHTQKKKQKKMGPVWLKSTE